MIHGSNVILKVMNKLGLSCLLDHCEYSLIEAILGTTRLPTVALPLHAVPSLLVALVRRLVPLCLPLVRHLSVS